MVETSETSDTGAPLERWRALDLFRLAAVLLMVQGHVFTELLDPAIRQEPWYVHHRYLHGFTAPIFFVSSGLAFAVATLRHWPEHIRMGAAARRRFERYGWLLFIGYILSLPKLSVRQLLSDPTGEYARAFFRVGALENIAVSLAALQAVVWLSKRPRRFAAVVTALALACVFVAPYAASVDATEWMSLGLAAYINTDTGSYFPLFPWAGFIFAGALAACLSTRPTGSLRNHRTLAFAAAGFALWFFSRATQPGEDILADPAYWDASPHFFFLRLGLVLLAFSFLCAYEALSRRPARPAARGATDLVQRLSQETLVIYVAHLILLYWWIGESPLPQAWAPGLGVWGALAVSTGVFALSALTALVWAHLRTRHPHRFRRGQLGLATAVTIVALANPG